MFHNPVNAVLLAHCALNREILTEKSASLTLDYIFIGDDLCDGRQNLLAKFAISRLTQEYILSL